jgi:glycosyltransferase involved in cell wall biosynthesis
MRYPTIDPLPDTGHRPFWSVMIPTHNRVNYLEKTIKSVLDQDPGQDCMQIEVIDNFSSPELNVEELVREIGDSRVLYYRQPHLVDFQENWSTCIRRSVGRYVHILHDDDRVLPGFYKAYQQFIDLHPEVKLIFSQAIHIDDRDQQTSLYKPAIPDFPNGVIDTALPLLVQENFIYSTSVVVPREIYEKIGGFHPSVMHTVDWDMWLRISLEGPIGYVQQPLLAYRIHSKSGSYSQNNTLELIDKKYEDICYIINTYQDYLPPSIRRATAKHFMRSFAISANTQMKYLLKHRKYLLASHHALWSKKMYPSSINRSRLWWYNLCYFREDTLT